MSKPVLLYLAVAAVAAAVAFSGLVASRLVPEVVSLVALAFASLSYGSGLAVDLERSRLARRGHQGGGRPW
jgi:hypothetical protein